MGNVGMDHVYILCHGNNEVGPLTRVMLQLCYAQVHLPTAFCKTDKQEGMLP